MKDNGWPVEWTRGVLGPAVLSIIAAGETYGYAIAQRLDAAGFGTVKGSTLYPMLNRYETEGVLTSVWREGDGGPGRKFFALTDDGREALAGLRSDWRRFTHVADALIGTGGTSTSHRSRSRSTWIS